MNRIKVDVEFTRDSMRDVKTILLSRVPCEGEQLALNEDDASLTVHTVFHLAAPRKSGAVAMIRVR